MENYNIYDEIGRGTHSFVYKARRKRSIEYVAVKSTAKSRMDKILNEVPFLHKLDSRYVLKFFDWYESSNHIWLILEYCMGGDLLNLITQDKRLPEAAVKTFGMELVAGLQYLHTNSILYCDLKPANVLIDEFGSLKLADFGLARRIPGSEPAATRPLTSGSPHYMAPELFQQPAVHSFASDFWALGCVLYELRTGRQPFTHTDFSELARKIQTEAVELPVPGCEMSPALCNLLHRLLEKDPYQRITWDELVEHPFWDGLPRLDRLVMPPQELFDSASPHSVENDSGSDDASTSGTDEAQSDSDNEDDGHYTDQDDIIIADDNEVIGNAATAAQQAISNEENTAVSADNCGEIEAVLSNSDDSDSDISESGTSRTRRRTQDETRPVSAPGGRTRAPPNNNEDLDEDLQEDLVIASSELAAVRHRWRIANAPHSAPPAIRHAPRQRIQLSGLFDRSDVPGSGLRKVSKLIFTAADCRVKSIIGNNDIQIGDVPRVQADLLRFNLITPEELLSCSTEALENQLKEIYISLKSSQADDREKLSVMAYLFSLSCHARLAHVIVNSSILKLLIRMLAQEARLQSPDTTLLPTLCLVLGVLFRFATFITPSAPDQLGLLVKTLLEVVEGCFVELRGVDTGSSNGFRSRPVALACLGELLFYISTQQEWELPMEGMDVVLKCVDDADIAVRYYAVRTLSNMLIHSTDSLLTKLMSDTIVLTLIRRLLSYVTAELDTQEDLDEEDMLMALRTTTTEALAQILRHLRTPSSVAHLPSRLKRSILLFFAKPDILNAVWRGVQGSTDLAIASLNIINTFLDIKLNSDHEAEAAAIRASRTLLLERVVDISTIQKVLQVDQSMGGRDADESLTVQRAKCLLTLYLGVQLNRDFLLSFVDHNSVDLLEQTLAPIADKLCVNDSSDSLSSESKLSACEMYLAQCALNLCKLSIRMALKLGADCFSSYESDDSDATSNNAEHRSPRISPVPFYLISGLLRNANCRQQLLSYFIANDSKPYTFFLRLVTKLLSSFPDDMVTVSGELETKRTIAACVSEVLLNLFEFAASEANDIVLVEKHVLFSHLLPVVVEHVYGGPERNNAEVAINCIGILNAVLLDFDFEDENGEYELYDPFIRSVLLPHFHKMLRRRDAMTESVWSLTSELLFGLLSSDSSLLREAEDLNLVSTVTMLLCIPNNFHSLPSHATQLVQLLLDSADITSDLLYESGIARGLTTALEFSTKRNVADDCLVELTIILLSLLHQAFERTRQIGTVTAPTGFDELVACGPLMLELCARGGIGKTLDGRPKEALPENDMTDESNEGRRRDAELADLASRCLVFLSQLFGAHLNEVMFAKRRKPFDPGPNASVASLLVSCLQADNFDVDGVVLLRMLLALKNCVRSQDNHLCVSNWLMENSRVINAVKTLATSWHLSQPETNSRSIGEQVSKTAAALVRLCHSSSTR